MTIPLLTTLPAGPNHLTQLPADFSTTAVAYVAAQSNMVDELNNQVIPAINDVSDMLNSYVLGTEFSLPYTFSTTTTDSDPGTGIVRLSSATQSSATVIRLDLVGSDGETYTNWIDTWDDSTSSSKGTIVMYKLSDATKWIIFALTSIASPAGYKNLTVAPILASETNPFTNSDALGLKFLAKGDKGDAGSGGVADMFRVDRTSNTILAAADRGKIMNVTSGTFTQTITACATLADGWWLYYRNSGTGRVTLDPNGAETINGASTLIVEPGETYLLQGNGTLLFAMKIPYSGTDIVTVHTGNGHGSTNTKIRRFTTTMTSTGSAITYADSASAGGSFTINASGLYEIHYTDDRGTTVANAFAGVSVNSSELTTSVDSITVASRLSVDRGGNTNEIAFLKNIRTVALSATDVVRAHTDGNLTGTSNLTFFSIRRIA
jgi:hypothetical protein